MEKPKKKKISKFATVVIFSTLVHKGSNGKAQNVLIISCNDANDANHSGT